MAKGDEFTKRYKRSSAPSVSATRLLLRRRLCDRPTRSKRRRTPDRLALVDAMPKTSFEGLTANIEFDEQAT